MLDYFNVQVANSLQNVQTVESRFWIIGKLLKELITPGILLVITLLISVLAPSSSTVAPHKKMAFVLLFLALSGVLPIIISLKQSGFYFIPALGIFSLSFALLIYHKVDKLYQKINTKHLAFKLFKVITFSGVLIGFFIIIMNAGTDGRDHEKLSDIRLIKNKLAKNRILEANSHVKQDWTSLSYFYRYYKISIELTDTPSKQFYLTLKSLDIRQSEYQASELELFYFKLYEHN